MSPAAAWQPNTDAQGHLPVYVGGGSAVAGIVGRRPVGIHRVSLPHRLPAFLHGQRCGAAESPGRLMKRPAPLMGIIDHRGILPIAAATDADAKLHRKRPGMEAKLCFIGHGPRAIPPASPTGTRRDPLRRRPACGLVDNAPR